jgi:2-polyprenyl-3-methyl-5-hydroxy-6-metoxy-1,4-benzoquinol methylase
VNLESLPQLDRRLPPWANGTFAERLCPLCGARREPVLCRPDGLPLSFCGDCRLWFVASALPEEMLAQFYTGYWHGFRAAPRDWIAARRMRAAAKAVAAHDLRLLRLEALLGGLQGRRILDVGCGLGRFMLAAAARGADVVGQEVSSEACDFVRERLGLQVCEGPLETCADAVGFLDAVVMMDLIEHVLQPRGALEIARRVLAPGGLLLLWTPNGGAAGESLATARSWVGFRVDLDHLQFFSPATVVSVARQLGWGVEHLETLGSPDLATVGKERPFAPTAVREAVKFLASRIPGARRAVGGLRAFGRELGGAGPHDERRGTYHLFAILRKA